MSTKKIVFSAIVIFVLISCADKEDSISCQTGDSEILGCWKTEVCENLVDKDFNPIDLWGKGVYEFKKRGVLLTHYYSFTDNQCQSGNKLITFTNSDIISFSYNVDENVSNIDGFDVKDISITSIFEGESNTVNGFFKIEDDRLCTANNLRLTVRSISWSEVNEPIMNTNSCLIRVNEI